MSRKVRWGVGILICVPLAYGLWQLISATRAAASIARSRQNLKQIGQALHSYHEQYACFPPAYVLGPDGKPWHSWRVLLLPFLGEASLSERYRFDEPWDGPHNKQLLRQRPSVFASSRQKSESSEVTTYLGVVSRRSMWPAHFSVKLSDVTDGEKSTLFLLENDDSDVLWSEPRDMREKDALSMFPPRNKEDQSGSSTGQPIPVLFVDGRARAISTLIRRDFFRSLLTPKFGRYMVADGWPLDDESVSKLPNVLDISHYAGTRIAPVPETKLDERTTTIYCATVQIAWDLLRPADGAPVEITGRSQSADLLNADRFPRDALDATAYFADFSELHDEDSAALFKKFHRKFPEAPVEMLGGSADGPGLRILAYLQKSLPFIDVMERFPSPLKFHNGDEQSAVHSFGWSSSEDPGETKEVLKETVKVRDFVSNEDFILVLNSASPRNDEIILAKIPRGGTLQSTWLGTADRLQTPLGDALTPELRAFDQLQIPIISFGVVASLTELVGLGVPTVDKPDRFIADARQTIRFRLDEYGAELIADTQMILSDSSDGALESNPVPRRLIFDRPFLLALKEKKATRPYFLAWIGNAELLEAASR
ncbi:MAG: DUF1559 domain-containing protein [Planctomycetales bacterium]